MSDLARYQRAFTCLNVNMAGGRRSPHKVCMLLAVLDLARSGALPRNEIRYTPPLLDRYNRYFSAVRAAGDHSNAYFPFFHLQGALRGGGSSFWRLVPRPGEEAVLARMPTARSHADISAVIDYAELDPALFALLQSVEALDALAETLARHWFDRGLEELRDIAKSERLVTAYERCLRNVDVVSLPPTPPPEAIRSAAFRRVVLENYDYRCSATGERVLLPDGTAMVEAAHLRPFAESADDDPRNGVALTPDMHWAMDRRLIAPGPDHRWHVHPGLDERIPDYRRLVMLQHKPLLLPREARMYPRRDVLEWRLRQLARRL
jgi:putative restriction endonuclease